MLRPWRRRRGRCLNKRAKQTVLLKLVCEARFGQVTVEHQLRDYSRGWDRPSILLKLVCEAHFSKITVEHQLRDYSRGWDRPSILPKLVCEAHFSKITVQS